MIAKLPKILEKEPLVEAVFEVRMGGEPLLADLLPGVLYGQLEPRPELQRLPAAEIPKPIRAADPNLVFAPLVRLNWHEFTISIGDRSFVVACKLPYPKWPRFKEAVLDIVGKVAAIGISGSVERYSLKYVNLIEAPTISQQINKINISVKVGDVQVNEEHVSVQVHRREKDTIHILSIITGAEGKLGDDRQISGVVVDIDSIRIGQFPNFEDFASQLEPAVETLRQENKVKFFSCLTDATINDMGPTYD